MAGVAELVLNIVGKSEADKHLDRVADSARDMDKAVRGADESAGELVDKLDEISQKIRSDNAVDLAADSFGNLERVMIGLGDQLGVLEEQFGLPIGPAREWTQAAADVTGGLEGIIAGTAGLVRSLPAMQAAMQTTIAISRAMAASMLTPPMGIVIALAAVGIAAYIFRDDIIAAFKAVWDFIGPTVITIRDSVIGAFNAVLDFGRNNWPEIITIISGPFAPLVALATDAFGVRSALTGAFQAALDWVSGNWPEIATIISGPFAPIVALATDAFGIRSALTGALQEVMDFLSGAWETAVWAARQVIFAFRDAFFALRDAAKAAAKAIADVPGGIAGGIGGAIGGVGGAIGGALGFAEGGVVPGPTGAPRLAVVHGGEEVLTPEQRRAGGSGGGVTVNMTGPITINSPKDAQRAAKDFGFVLAANLRARGLMVPA